ncbi:MAG: hypothetical protein JXA77_07315 [Bacteroidales bacterium]|nr:hypothetical protein [Bacteroidales bacterium]MBN2819685.1 hypothetical protein [Bacteroidales bacterium]
MSKRRLSAALAFASVILIVANAQDKKTLLDEFISNDWQVVKAAKVGLENLQGAAIPELIEILDNENKEKLTNTGSLIYPGAERFFGHGQILDYDIDYLAIRAGWLIEEIAFTNFGFTGIHLMSNDAVNFIKITYPDYFNNSGNRKKIEGASQEELRSIIQELATEKAKQWWKVEKENFSRLQALLDALRSFDEKRQVKALFYLRNGVTKCDGLSRDFYYDEIIKDIGRLSGSDLQRIAEHAKLILLDTKLEWLAMKVGE